MVVFESSAFDDFNSWAQQDNKIYRKIEVALQWCSDRFRNIFLKLFLVLHHIKDIGNASVSPQQKYMNLFI
jgi:hypothetical protein